MHTAEIHLLITDIILPEMNGRELGENLISIYPDLKVLFMSGYTSDVITRQGVLVEDIHFIQKPFSKVTLAVKVREVLGNKKISDYH
jgi:two-component system sensor histidine kinase EvgS